MSLLENYENLHTVNKVYHYLYDAYCMGGYSDIDVFVKKTPLFIHNKKFSIWNKSERFFYR